ncbi:MAG: hypothetical protein QOJ82_460 [Solirubrobacteraceae bacterium]|jgi:hypothetical protein|nr:hypothetical protein [Solirubrobacteraceae bacterium]
MAFVRLFDNPQGSQEQYDAASQAIGVTSDNVPDGAIVHVDPVLRVRRGG